MRATGDGTMLLSGCTPQTVRRSNGVGGIRTHERVSPLAVFKTAAFNHSATTPGAPKVFGHRVIGKWAVHVLASRTPFLAV